jgi:hypothetical protein
MYMQHKPAGMHTIIYKDINQLKQDISKLTKN